MPPGDSDTASWEEWFKKHGASLLIFARQWLPDRADAEDAVQEAFARFWRSRQGVADARAYLYACVKNCALDFLRGRRRQKRREEAAARLHPEASPGWFQAGLENEDRVRSVETALQDLPSEQRRVLVLKIWGELTFAQIGEVLDASPDTVASRYRYALLDLRRKLPKESFL